MRKASQYPCGAEMRGLKGLGNRKEQSDGCYGYFDNKKLNQLLRDTGQRKLQQIRRYISSDTVAYGKGRSRQFRDGEKSTKIMTFK